MAGSTSRKTGFTIRLRGRKLEFYSRCVTLKAYCAYCKREGKDPYECSGLLQNSLSRLSVARLLRSKVNSRIKLKRTWDSTKSSSGRITIGCQSFRLSPSNMRRVRRWALKP